MTTLKLRSRQWIVNEEGEIIMGEGRKKILETIDSTGSINQTAKMMKMSYKGVWSKIKATEKYLGSKLVEGDKRGSYLTEQGKALLEKYSLLKKRCVIEDDRIFQKIFDPGDR